MSPPGALRCPFPDCTAALGPEAEPAGRRNTIDEATLRGELVVCPVCRRASARCTRFRSDGRCPALNRPLARFCRHCCEVLAPGWAEQRWDLDLREEGRPLAVGPPEVVLELDRWLAPSPWRAWPIELRQAGGRLWLGCSDGRCLFVEPFADRNSNPVIRDQIWDGTEPVHLRARVDGPWLVISSQRGIRALNLLALDDRTEDHSPVPVWDVPAGPNHRLASDPVLFPRSPGSDSVIVWLAMDGARALSLHSAVLSLSDQTPQGRQVVLLNAGAGRGPALEDEREQALLLPAAFGPGRAMLLCTQQEIWLLDGLGVAPVSRVTLAPLLQHFPALRGARVRTHMGEVPGVVFMPGATDDPSGQVFFSYQSQRGPALCALTVSPGGQLSLLPYSEGGVPVELVESSDNREVLCLAGGQFVLCTRMRQRPTGASNYLREATRIHAQGRLAVATGTQKAGTTNHRFTLVVDLQRAAIVLADSSPQLSGHPVLLGPYLFTVEGSGQQTLRLVRRKISAGG